MAKKDAFVYQGNVPDYSIIFTFKSSSLLHRLVWFFSNLRPMQPIEKWRRSAHAFIYLKDGMIAEVNQEGLKVKKAPIGHKRSTHHICVGRVTVPFNAKAIDAFAERAHGKVKYDYFRILLIAIRKLFGGHRIKDYSKDLMMCVEWCIWAFRAAGVNLTPGLDPSTVTPVTLMQSEKLDVDILE